MKILLIAFATLLLSNSSFAAVDPIADLLEKYVGDDGALRDTEKRLNFHPIDPHSTIPMPTVYYRFCAGMAQKVHFEAKRGEYIHWGLKNSVRTGGVTLTEFTPRGTTTTTVQNHMYYKACVMDPRMIEAVQKLACDDRIQATHVIVNSAFRDPITNLLQGGRSASQHLKCRAIDFAFEREDRGRRSRISPSQVQGVAAQYSIVTGLGRGRTFTHVDTRPGRRATWNYSRKVALESHDSSLTLSLAE